MGYHLNARYGAAGNAPGRLWRGLVAVILSFALFLQGAIPVQAALFGSFGVKDEKELGRKFDVLVRSRMPLVEDPEIKGYIQSIVDRLSKTFPPQPFPFTANVLLHNSMNAFAVPGGSVFVHTGLIMQLDHESELAGVLGHELAHVTQRHIATRMERAQAVTIGSLVGALAAALLGGGQGSGAIFAGSVAAGQAAMLNYSRMDETEADQIGLQYLTSAGYRPQGLQGAFEKIRRKQWASGIDIPEYLSTHPDVGGRINEIHARIQGLPAAVRNRKDDDTRFNRVKTLIWARYGDPDAAARFFAKQLEGKKPDCLAYMGQGILAERRNQIKDADAAFSKALACAPGDALVVREAGRFYYNKGDARAGRTLLRALELDPNDIMAQFFYARLLDGSLATEAEYLALVHRVFDNAILYNKPSDDVAVMAHTLSDYFERERLHMSELVAVEGDANTITTRRRSIKRSAGVEAAGGGAMARQYALRKSGSVNGHVKANSELPGDVAPYQYNALEFVLSRLKEKKKV